MPKRLLRYALARLDLLDHEALDLDNLDLALGRNTVFEFKDVGVQLPVCLFKLLYYAYFVSDLPKKLERLLKLPPAFRIEKAKVLLLRVTIPMDFYASPITIEVDGVNVIITVDSVHKPVPGDLSDMPAVPNAADLAESFLAAEPHIDKKELEAALAAENHDLAASTVSTDDGSETDTPLGTGAPLTLPGFLADFLQGLLDRIQISVSKVSFQVGMEVAPDHNSTVPEPVSFNITLDKIDVHGITSNHLESEEFQSASRVGKKHILVQNVRAFLLSEANIFQPSRSLSPSSSAFAQSPHPAFLPSLDPTILSRTAARPVESEALTAHDDDQEDLPLADSEIALQIPYELPDNNYVEDESPPTPRASVSHELDATAASRTLRSSQSQLQGSSTFENSTGSDIRTLFMLKSSELGQHDAANANEEDFSDAAEDLSASRVYSHEGNESMYMSALSSTGEEEIQESTPLNMVKDDEPKPNSPPTESASPAQPKETTVMPGAWGHESSMSGKAVIEANRINVDKSASESITASKMTETTETEDKETDAKDDAPTPKGPTILMKEILSLNEMSVFVPSTQKLPENSAVAVGTESMYQSYYPQAPGAFSVHGQRSQSHQPEADEKVGTPLDDSIELYLSPITINFDTSLVFLLVNALSQLLNSVQEDSAAAATPEPGPPQATSKLKRPSTKLHLESVAINFLSRLSGVVTGHEAFPDDRGPLFGPEVLLNLTVNELTLHSLLESQTGGDQTKSSLNTISTDVKIKSFRFGYAEDDILSFDSGRPMSMSIRDTFLTAGHHIGIKVKQNSEGLKAEFETLPLLVRIDLQRLDETFSWFGGLSSFLNMSTSVAMASPSKSATISPPSVPRGVHFDTPIDPDDKSTSAKNKINVRVGGSFIELVGKECSITAETSALKLVSRDEGVGMACSMIRISGPYIINSAAAPAVNIEVNGTRVDFLSTPKTTDLEKLLELIIPSKVKYDHNSDEIMVDTLLRQRRKGSVLRVGVELVTLRVKNMAQLSVLPDLADELAKLSAVAKYLPEDDRPGILTLAKIQKINTALDFGNHIGLISTELRMVEIGQISIPSLVAVVVQDIKMSRNGTETLAETTNFGPARDLANKPPAIMARMIGDEMEPIVKLKLHNLLVEYRVPTVMDFLGLSDEATPQDFDECLAASVASLGDQTHIALARQSSFPTTNAKSEPPMKLDIVFHDCLLGLNPLKLDSKMVIALTDARVEVTLPKEREMRTELNINKASILLTDDATQLLDSPARDTRTRHSAAASTQVVDLCSKGYVDICYISSAMAIVNIKPGSDGADQVEVDVRDDLLVLETCADSTQTLITLANALKPPTPPSKENKYKTNVLPVKDLLASISAEAFGQAEGDYDFDQDFAGAQEMAGSGSEFDIKPHTTLPVEPRFYRHESGEELFDATKEPSLSREPTMEETQDGVLLTDPTRSQNSFDSDDLEIHDDFFAPVPPSKEETVKVWNSVKNTYDTAPVELVRRSPIKVNVRDVHVIWNLFDGYDWTRTRDVITKAVQEVEHRAHERQSRHGGQALEEEEEEETIGDFLFNSIYIGIPANRDPNDLARAINEELNDNATETESVATTAFTSATTRTARRLHHKPKRLRLNRSKHHKITFELQGLNIDMVMFPPEGTETLSSIDVRVKNLDIFDHVPTSTWKKFATYDLDQGEREMGTSMVHLEILTVKPLPQLGASEIVLRATVLPLRLHVDQDALDFITRFFEFKDDKVPVHASPSDVPFVQRAEVNSIPVKLDFKPKRVDYAGLRSGHTTEFMNFIVLEESRLVLRHAIIYGTTGFDRLGQTLNDIWMPDVRNNQLPGVIAGLAPVRSLVNIGSGFKDLIEVPIREYQKDGRVIRSISKGAIAFARGTGTEIVKFGAKLAVGTQYALQGAEELLAQPQTSDAFWEDDELDEEDKKQVSLYADQPAGVVQGIRGGYRSMVRDMNLAKDAIIAVPAEVMQSQSAAGAAQAVLKRAPTIIFRPAMGMTKVLGKTLMGATNAIDPQNRRRVEDKYKH